jgi:hypothetical protein
VTDAEISCAKIHRLDFVTQKFCKLDFATQQFLLLYNRFSHKTICHFLFTNQQNLLSNSNTILSHLEDQNDQLLERLIGELAHQRVPSSEEERKRVKRQTKVAAPSAFSSPFSFADVFVVCKKFPIKPQFFGIQKNFQAIFGEKFALVPLVVEYVIFKRFSAKNLPCSPCWKIFQTIFLMKKTYFGSPCCEVCNFSSDFR